MSFRSALAVVAIGVAGVGMVGCSIASPDTDELTVQGTVRFVTVEGGCWVLEASTGTRFEPVGLPEAFKEDGRRVVARLSNDDDLGSYCMVGQLMRLVSIRDR